MSAFILPREHIHAMVAAGLKSDHGSSLRWFRKPLALGGIDYREDICRLTHETAAAVGQMLVDQNVKSIEARYQDCEDMIGDARDPYTFETAAVLWPMTPVAMLKAISCYEYQSCEDDGWHRSEAQQFCEALRGWMISQLPGYDSAATWEYTGPPVGVARSGVYRLI
jgi:hypothetical protein